MQKIDSFFFFFIKIDKENIKKDSLELQDVWPRTRKTLKQNRGQDRVMEVPANRDNI